MGCDSNWLILTEIISTLKMRQGQQLCANVYMEN